MDCRRNLSALIFILGVVFSSAENNFLLNICFGIGTCRSNDSYLQLTPPNFQSNMYNYTIHISNQYPFYTPRGPIHVNFYVYMNVSNPDPMDIKETAIGYLYDATGEQALGYSELAFSPYDMLLISADLGFGIENRFESKLMVYQYDSYNNIKQRSHPYTFTFTRDNGTSM